MTSNQFIFCILYISLFSSLLGLSGISSAQSTAPATCTAEGCSTCSEKSDCQMCTSRPRYENDCWKKLLNTSVFRGGYDPYYTYHATRPETWPDSGHKKVEKLKVIEDAVLDLYEDLENNRLEEGEFPALRGVRGGRGHSVYYKGFGFPSSTGLTVETMDKIKDVLHTSNFVASSLPVGELKDQIEKRDTQVMMIDLGCKKLVFEHIPSCSRHAFAPEKLFPYQPQNIETVDSCCHQACSGEGKLDWNCERLLKVSYSNKIRNPHCPLTTKKRKPPYTWRLVESYPSSYSFEQIKDMYASNLEAQKNNEKLARLNLTRDILGIVPGVYAVDCFARGFFGEKVGLKQAIDGASSLAMDFLPVLGAIGKAMRVKPTTLRKMRNGGLGLTSSLAVGMMVYDIYEKGELDPGQAVFYSASAVISAIFLHREFNSYAGLNTKGIAMEQMLKADDEVYGSFKKLDQQKLSEQLSKISPKLKNENTSAEATTKAIQRVYEEVTRRSLKDIPDLGEDVVTAIRRKIHSTPDFVLDSEDIEQFAGLVKSVQTQIDRVRKSAVNITDYKKMKREFDDVLRTIVATRKQVLGDLNPKPAIALEVGLTDFPGKHNTGHLEIDLDQLYKKTADCDGDLDCISQRIKVIMQNDQTQQLSRPIEYDGGGATVNIPTNITVKSKLDGHQNITQCNLSDHEPLRVYMRMIQFSMAEELQHSLQLLLGHARGLGYLDDLRLSMGVVPSSSREVEIEEWLENGGGIKLLEQELGSAKKWRYDVEARIASHNTRFAAGEEMESVVKAIIYDSYTERLIEPMYAYAHGESWLGKKGPDLLQEIKAAYKRLTENATQ